MAGANDLTSLQRIQKKQKSRQMFNHRASLITILKRIHPAEIETVGERGEEMDDVEESARMIEKFYPTFVLLLFFYHHIDLILRRLTSQFHPKQQGQPFIK